jgi:hypothetical protein
MNKKVLFLGILFLSLYLSIPVLALPSNCGWSTLPMTDPADDVIRYNVSVEDPWEGVKVDSHPEVDILRVSFVGVNLSIEFGTIPSLATYHGYSIYIDTDNDEESEYIIATFIYGELYLKRESDEYYWNTTNAWSGWTGYPTRKNVASVSGSNLTIIDLNLAGIPNYKTAKYAITASNSTLNPIIYKDFAPLDPYDISDGGIPGFAWLFTCFALIALLGIIFLQKRVEPPL